MGQSPKNFGGEGGKKVRAAQASYARSQNICPVHLIRAVAAIGDRGGRDQRSRLQAARKNFFAKRRMRAGRCGLGHTSPTLGVGGNWYAKSPNMFCNIQFNQRGIRDARAGRRKIDIY